jgi:hypothetical protein
MIGLGKRPGVTAARWGLVPRVAEIIPRLPGEAYLVPCPATFALPYNGT